jgi:metallo-beta-lactamase class B
MKFTRAALFILTVFLSFVGGISAQTTPGSQYLIPFPAYKIIGNVYFVGTQSLGDFLIVTPQGNILINSGLEGNVPLLEQSMEKLGFHFKDTKILLISQAHFDHDAGNAKVKELTGAKYMVMDADVPVVESGGKADFYYNDSSELSADTKPLIHYPPAKVDRVLHDGDTVELGGTVLTAHLTPGHTKGCTTWTMRVNDAGKTYDVVIVGGVSANEGYQLVNNAVYPQMAADFEKTFRVLKLLHCDVFLGAHGSYYDMEAKYARMKDGASNPFIDPDGYSNFVEEYEKIFRTELDRQTAAAKQDRQF